MYLWDNYKIVLQFAVVCAHCRCMQLALARPRRDRRRRSCKPRCKQTALSWAGPVESLPSAVSKLGSVNRWGSPIKYRSWPCSKTIAVVWHWFLVVVQLLYVLRSIQLCWEAGPLYRRWTALTCFMLLCDINFFLRFFSPLRQSWAEREQWAAHIVLTMRGLSAVAAVFVISCLLSFTSAGTFSRSSYYAEWEICKYGE